MQLRGLNGIAKWESLEGRPTMAFFFPQQAVGDGEEALRTDVSSDQNAVLLRTVCGSVKSKEPQIQVTWQISDGS